MLIFLSILNLFSFFNTLLFIYDHALFSLMSCHLSTIVINGALKYPKHECLRINGRVTCIKFPFYFGFLKIYYLIL